jgi:hypothetical protein
MEAIIDRRPPHWVSLLPQAALRSTADGINSAYVKAGRGEDAYAFSCWTQTFMNQYEQLLHDWSAVFQNELPAATGQRGKAGDADSILMAFDHVVGVIHDAIVMQGRAVFLSRHPVFGDLAAPLREIAKPFVDSCNELLRSIDEQLPTMDQTGRLQVHVNLQSPPAFEEASIVYEQYISKLSEHGESKRADVFTERFNIARGKETLGEFGRSAIRDNLHNGLFRGDDWYWSYEHEQWKPLSDLE